MMQDVVVVFKSYDQRPGDSGQFEAVVYMYLHLEPQTTIYKWMFGETTIFYVKIRNHPIETTIYKWLFGVPGICATCCRPERL